MAIQIKHKELSKLKFGKAERPTAAGKTPRQRFLEAIQRQKGLVANPVKPEEGKRSPHKWWFEDRSGTWWVTPKYGPHSIAIDDENPAIRAGSEKGVADVLIALEKATEEGAFDDILKQLSDQTANRLKRK